MINYKLLHIHRAILHKVMARRQNIEPSVVESQYLLSIDAQVEGILKERLSDSFAQTGKSFELSINAVEADSTFSMLNGLNDKSDREFVAISKQLAAKLAETQQRVSIPHGFMLLLDCENTVDNLPVYIIMKAEPHEALVIAANNIATALSDVILSPSQKMYKAASFQQVNAGVQGVGSYKAYLFDEQFQTRASLAEYFYKDFLGLTISQNDKVLTKMFFYKMLEGISTKYATDFIRRNDAEDALRAEMQNQQRLISPRAIIDRIIEVDDRDYFYNKISNTEIPTGFTKNLSLIDGKISHRGMSLSEDVKIYAPQDMFGSSILVDRDTDHDYIIVKIPKPNN